MIFQIFDIKTNHNFFDTIQPNTSDEKIQSGKQGGQYIEPGLPI